MNGFDKINNILKEQAEQAALLEQTVKELAAQDFIKQNKQLENQILALTNTIEQGQKRLSGLEGENRDLKQKLANVLSIQKSNSLAHSKQCFEEMFFGMRNNSVNRLKIFEQSTVQRLHVMKGNLEQKQFGEQQVLIEEINQMQAKIHEFTAKAEEQLNNAFSTEYQKTAGGYESFQKEQLNLHAIPKPPSKANLEQKIGEKVTIIAGLLFVLIAVILGLRYTYTNLLHSAALKITAAYLLGIIFIAAGEWLGRKNKTVFSLGLDSGGIGILFAATAVAHFNLGVFSKTTALSVCILITGLTLFLAFVRNSQLIGIFAFIGGYLPMTAVGHAFSMVTGAKVYFLLLNILVLIIAARKDWKVIRFFSFAVHTIGFVFLLLIQDKAYFYIDIAYVMLSFVMYLLISLIYPMLKKVSPTRSDAVLSGINIWILFSVNLLILGIHGYWENAGIVTALFGVLVFAMAKQSKRFLPADLGIRGMLYASSLALLFLAVPLHFEYRLYVLGWLFEGTALSIYGIITKKKWYRYAGWVLNGAAVLIFLADSAAYFGYRYQAALYVWKYSILTLALLTIWLVRKRTIQDTENTQADRNLFRVFQCIVLINIWLYLSWITWHFITEYVAFPEYTYWRMAAFTLLTILIPYIVQKLNQLTGSDRIAMSLIHILGFVLVLYLNQGYFIHERKSIQIISHIILIILNFSGVVMFREFLKSGVLKTRAISNDIKAVLVCTYAFLLISQVMLVQFSVGIESMALSFIYLAGAIATIYFGFRLLYPALRRFGLVLSFGAVSKLFLLDLGFLENWQRIVSYFVFGFTLIGISYIYQYMNKGRQ